MTASRRVDVVSVVGGAGHGDKLQVFGFCPQVGYKLDSGIKIQEGIHGGVSIGEMGGDIILSHFLYLSINQGVSGLALVAEFCNVLCAGGDVPVDAPQDVIEGVVVFVIDGNGGVIRPQHSETIKVLRPCLAMIQANFRRHFIIGGVIKHLVKPIEIYFN